MADLISTPANLTQEELDVLNAEPAEAQLTEEEKQVLGAGAPLIPSSTLSEEEKQVLGAGLPAGQTLTEEELSVLGNKYEGEELKTGPQNQSDSNLGAAVVSPEKKEPKYERQNTLFGDLVTQPELSGIAAKHGLKDAKELSTFVELLGGNKESEGILNNVLDSGKAIVGQLSKSVGMGLPSLALIESQSDQGLKDALYELRELADQKQGLAATIGQGAAAVASSITIGNVLAPAAAAATGLTAARAAAGTQVVSNIFGGAVAGFAGSNKREEAVHDALEGAGWGAAISAIPIVGKTILGGAKYIKQTLRAQEPLKGKVIQEIEKAAAKLDASTGTAQKMLAEGNFASLYDATEVAKRSTPEAMNKEVSAYLKDLSPEGRQTLAEELKDQGIQAAAENKFIFQRKVQQDITNFASSVAGREITTPSLAKEILQKFSQREGLQSLGEAFEHHLEKKAADTLMKESLTAILPHESNSLNRIYDGVKDARYSYEAIDRRLGTKTVPVIDDLSQAGNLFGNEMRKVLPALKEVTEKTKKTDLTNAQIYEYLDKGLTPTNPTHIEAVQGWKDFFATQKKRANDLGLPIPDFVNKEGAAAYVPHQRVFGTDLVDRLTGQVELIAKEHGINILTQSPKEAKLGEEFFKGRTYQDLRESIAYMRGGTITDGQPGLVGLTEVRDSLRDIFRGKPLERDLVRGSSVSTMFQREMEEVPKLIRNTDMVELAVGWTNSTFKHAYMKKGIAELAKVRDVALTLGDDRAAGYISKHLEDLISPSSRDTVSNALKQKKTAAYVELSLQAARGSKSAAIAKDLAKDGNDFISTVINQAYPNFLGFSPRATLQNLCQPFTMTVPELGYVYGAAHYMRAVRDMVTGTGGSRALNVLQEQGYLQKEFSKEMQDVLRNSVEASLPKNIGRKALDKYNDMAMWMYGMAEQLNRKTINTMAINVAEDMLAGKEAAKRFVGQMDPGSRRAIGIAMKNGDVGAVTDRMQKFLLGKTAYNYDKVSLAEYGRSVGPALAAFTKYPASMLGEALNEIEKGGAIRGTAGAVAKVLPKALTRGSLKIVAKYGLPAFALSKINGLLQEEGIMTPKQAGPSQVLLGKPGLVGVSPIGTFSSIIKGDLTPPLIGSILLAPVKGMKGVDDLLNTTMPFGSGIRVIDDMMQVLDGSHFGRTPLKVLEEQGIIEGKGQK
jgi:hypothetical protein